MIKKKIFPWVVQPQGFGVGFDEKSRGSVSEKSRLGALDFKEISGDPYKICKVVKSRKYLFDYPGIRRICQVDNINL